jgi:hypothetical protein
MFQSVLTVESDDDEDSTPLALPVHPRPDRNETMDTETDDEEEREYYIEVIDGVRHLQYSVVVPPDGPSEPLALAQQSNSENANEPHVNPTTHDSRWGESISTTGIETTANLEATQSSSVDPHPWGEGTFEPTWGTWRTRPAPDPYDPSWGDTTQRWERKEREKVITRGGSPPPKLEPETNLFHDDSTNASRKPIGQRRTTLLFKRASEKMGL